MTLSQAGMVYPGAKKIQEERERKKWERLLPKAPSFAPKKADRLPVGIEEALEKYGKGRNAALKAAEATDWKAVKALVLSDSDRARETTEYGELPLHLAVDDNAPLDVIETLITIYPEGIRQKTNEDERFRLPLHYSQAADLNLIKTLLREYPEGAKIKDEGGSLPIHHIVINTEKEGVIEELIKAYPESLTMVDGYDKLTPLELALENGQWDNAEVLRRLITFNEEEGREVSEGGDMAPKRAGAAHARKADRVGELPRVLERQGIIDIREAALDRATQHGNVPNEFRADREIVLAAVKKDGQALRYAADELKADREIVLAAVKKYGRALNYASDELKKDKEIILAAAK